MAMKHYKWSGQSHAGIVSLAVGKTILHRFCIKQAEMYTEMGQTYHLVVLTDHISLDIMSDCQYQNKRITGVISLAESVVSEIVLPPKRPARTEYSKHKWDHSGTHCVRCYTERRLNPQDQKYRLKAVYTYTQSDGTVTYRSPKCYVNGERAAGPEEKKQQMPKAD